MTDEKNKRLARGLDGIERPWTPRERYMLFVKGFRDGAGTRAMNAAAEGLGAYDRGYAEGTVARRQAAKSYAEEIGYEPTILRSSPVARACGNADCSVSTGIHEGLTFGRGDIDDHGFFAISCAPCARDHERRNPEGGACWPFPDAPKDGAKKGSTP